MMLAMLQLLHVALSHAPACQSLVPTSAPRGPHPSPLNGSTVPLIAWKYCSHEGKSKPLMGRPSSSDISTVEPSAWGYEVCHQPGPAHSRLVTTHRGNLATRTDHRRIAKHLPKVH